MTICAGVKSNYIVLCTFIILLFKCQKMSLFEAYRAAPIEARLHPLPPPSHHKYVIKVEMSQNF